MKSILIVFASLCLLIEWTEASENSRSTDSTLVKEFQQLTGLKPGNYSLVEGDPECPQGELVLMDVEGYVHIIMGARSLLYHIRTEPTERNIDEGRCQLNVSAGFTQRLDDGERSLFNRIREKCKNPNTQRKIVKNLEITNEGHLKYTSTSNENRLQCHYKRHGSLKQ